MRRLFIGCALVLSVVLTACPKDGPDTTGTPTPDATPTAGETDASATIIRYHWSGGFSIFEYYTLTLTERNETVESDFVVKPVKGDKRMRSEKVTYEEFAALQKMFDDVEFGELEQKDRGMKIMDIGRTVITYSPRGADSKELFEDPDTITTGDLKEIKAWFDRKVRTHLEAVSKPEDKTPQ